MKKLLTGIIALLMTGCLMASEVAVYKVVGVVKRKRTNSWENIEKQTKLNDTDIILIEKNSSLALVDKSNNRIYTCEAEGEWEVAEILYQCQTESKNMTRRLLSEVRKQIESSKQKTYTSLGGVKRDVWDEELLETVYTQLHKFILSKNRQHSSVVALKEVENGDGTSYLVIENKSEKVMYANVLCRPSTENTWSVLYESSSEVPCLEVLPDSFIEMKHVPVITNDGEYILFALPSPLDSEELNYMFEEKLEPEEGSGDYPIEIFMLNQ